MAESADVKILTFPVVLTGATEIPLVKWPSGFGGVTIISAYMINAGTSVGGQLVTMTAAGTPAINGTIGAFAGTITNSATVPAACTISDGYVSAGEWIGFDQTSGTIPAGSFLTVAYLLGK